MSQKNHNTKTKRKTGQDQSELAQQHEHIVKKYSQLKLSFSEFNASAPIGDSDLTQLKKIYLPKEFTHYPFFFQTRSKIVKDSREGYKIYSKNNYEWPDEDIMLNLKNLETKFVDEIQLSPDNKNTYTKFTKEWHIKASLEYGLPDSFDGHIWDIILQQISDIYKRYGRFFLYYHFSLYFIHNELYKQGIIKTSKLGGSLSNSIRDSFYRLKNTTYREVKSGFYRYDELKFEHQYDFNLITAIYTKNSKLPDSTIASSTAIAVDPLTLLNFIYQRYFIASNIFRRKLVNYKSRSLYDKLSYLAYINTINSHFPYLQKANMHPFVVISYKKLCNYLGFPVRKGSNYRRPIIDKQFKSIHEELLNKGIILNYFIHKKNKNFRIFYVYSDQFLENIYSLFSEKFKSNIEDEPSKECIKSIFQFLGQVEPPKEFTDFIHKNY